MKFSVQHKLSIIMGLSVILFLLAGMGLFQVSKGARFHQLNSLHLKYSFELSNLIFKNNFSVSDIERVRQTVLYIRQQPVECLLLINPFDHFVMDMIGTAVAIDLCRADVALADRTLESIRSYEAGAIQSKQILDILNAAAKGFTSNSSKFEKPIGDTVDFMVTVTFTVMFIIGSLSMILLVTGLRNISRTVTKIQKAEETLRKSEALFRAVTDNSPTKIHIKDIEGRYLLINKEAEKIFGVTNEEGYGKTSYDLFPKDIADTFIAHDQKIIETGMPRVEEEKFTLKDGVHTYLTIKFPILDLNGITGVGAIGTDITERRQAEDALRDSEARLRNILDNSRTPIYFKDLEGRFLVVNREYEKVYGVSFEDIKGKTSRLIFDDKSFEIITKHDLEVLKTRQSIAKVENVTGQEYLVTKFPIINDQGEVIGIGGIDTNITKIKQVEEALQASEERFRLAFENVAVGNIVISDKGIIEIFNSAAEKIFGYTKDEMIGQNVNMLMPEPDRNRHDGFMQNYLETGEAKIIGIGREVTGLRKNGEEFPMHLGVGEMRIGDNVSFVGSVSDLTQIKALEAQLKHSQRMEAVGQLTGGVAHDFNNLMGIMIGNAEMLEGKVSGDKEAEELIAAIIGAVERGANLTEHLLAFSRQLTLTPAEACANDLVLGIENMLRRTLGETINLKFVPDKSIWPVMIDAAQLEHALLNLCLNARDAMPKGGTLIIETLNTNLDETYAEQHEGVTPGDYVQVSVSDTGEGMASEVVEKAFEPFFTTKGVGEGSGLGLSMVFGFTQQSGGHVTIYSEVGKGTTVKVYLPRLVGAKKPVARVKEEPKELPRGTERILVVEDEEAVLEILMTALKEYGYEVAMAKNGNEALQLFKDGQTFDLLFTDVVLPGGMNGVEIAEEAERLQPGIRVLYTTGYTENIVVHNGVLDEEVALVKKPYRRAELLEKVRAALDGEDG